jgi:hypothetical protein
MLPGDFRILRGGPTDPGDGRDLMKTLMANGLFNGTSSSCAPGPLQLALSSSPSSSGEIQSLAAAENFPADSFFDVFAEFDTAIGPLHPDPTTPTHMRTTINAVPPEPGEIYYGPGTIIPIYDANGIQIGEILEVEHIVHGRIPCPTIFHRRLALTQAGQITDAAQSGGGGGGGLLTDMARGDVGQMKTGGGNFSAAVCLTNNNPGSMTDPLRPTVGRAFYYVARDVLQSALIPSTADFQDTWNTEEPGQTGNRDTTLAVCN